MLRILARLADTRVTCADAVYLMLKICICIGLCISLGPLFGIIGFVLLNYLVDLFIRLIFGLQPMNTTDKNVWFDQVSNRCNIMGAIVFEKTDPENIREVL